MADLTITTSVIENGSRNEATVVTRVNAATSNASQMHALRLLPSGPGRVRALSRAPPIAAATEYTEPPRFCHRKRPPFCCIMQHYCCTTHHYPNLPHWDFRQLRQREKWHRLCLVRGMDMNTTLFREISFQLTQGNPWWGLATCNEYEGLDSHIRAALVSIFRRRLALDEATSPLATALISGVCCRDLPESLRGRIGARVCKTVRPTLAPDSARKRAPRIAARRHSSIALHGKDALFSSSRRFAARQHLNVCVGEAQ